MTARSRLAAVAVAALAALPSASLAQYSPESQYSSSEFFRPHAELTAIAGYQVNTDVGISGATSASTMRRCTAPPSPG